MAMASISSLKISGVDYDIIAKSAMAAPAVELSAGTDLKIVDADKWIKYSDHLPLIFEIKE